jgi:hypothetical protein
MVVHSEDTSVAGLAVVCPRWLDVVASGTVASPELLKILGRLGSVHQKRFDLGVHAFKPFTTKVK